MKKEIRDRRLYLLNHYGRFFSLRDAVTDTAHKYSCKEHTLYVDWSRRDRWLKNLVSFDKNDTVIRQFILDLMRIMRDLEVFKYKADNDNARLGAMRLSVDMRFKLVDLLRQLEFDTEIKTRIERLEHAAREQGKTLYRSSRSVLS